MCGTNIAAFVLFPILGLGHPDNFPRFRDCHLSKCKQYIDVYARMGSGNRDCWESNEDNCVCPACQSKKIEKQENCISRIDDDFDGTYCTFKFKIPDEYKDDIKYLIDLKKDKISDKYKELIISTFPTIKDKLTNFLK